MCGELVIAVGQANHLCLVEGGMVRFVEAEVEVLDKEGGIGVRAVLKVSNAVVHTQQVPLCKWVVVVVAVNADLSVGSMGFQEGLVATSTPGTMTIHHKAGEGGQLSRKSNWDEEE